MNTNIQSPSNKDKSVCEPPIALRKLENVTESSPSSKFIHFCKVLFSSILGLHSIFFLFIIKFFPIQRMFLFLPHARWPLFIRFDKPEKFSIKGAINFYLTTKSNVKLGIWHIFPSSKIEIVNIHNQAASSEFNDNLPIFIYLHGNAGNRATKHRVQLYKKLQELNCHVIAFDYRNYGDSTAMPLDEVGVVEDAMTVIKWTLDHKNTSSVYVWGHSLGTGIAARAVTELEIDHQLFVNGVILESPFNNLTDEIKLHPLTLPFRNMIGFNFFFVDPLIQNNISFKSDEYLQRSKVPLLILHAENDWVVPMQLGEKLYKHLLEFRENACDNVRFVKFNSKEISYGHKHICECPDLQNVIRRFINGEYDEIPSCVS